MRIQSFFLVLAIILNCPVAQSQWVQTNGPASGVVSTLAASGPNLYAGTSTGVWRRPLAELITDVWSEHEFPQEYALQQNYPNPFNPTTVVRYQLP